MIGGWHTVLNTKTYVDISVHRSPYAGLRRAWPGHLKYSPEKGSQKGSNPMQNHRV